MSKGYGKMQRSILEHLRTRTGGDYLTRYDRLGGVLLSPVVHDMRVVAKELANKHGATYCGGAFIEGKWQASFSRAVRRLTECGELEFPWLVPIEGYGDYGAELFKGKLQHLADGLYLTVGNRQRRFGRLRSSSFDN